MKKNIKNNNLTIEKFISVVRNNENLTLSIEQKAKIKKARNIVEDAVNKGHIIYGITTGFGAFKTQVIDKNQTELLQKNLIHSHAVGVGNYLSTQTVRGIMALMVNYLSKGHSGVKLETVETLIKMLSSGVHPLVPEKGSVGSSGDLAPSAHVVLVLMGEGEAEYKGKNVSGGKAMKLAGIDPIKLGSKEGLALINNTATMTSIASLLIYDTKWILKISEIATALSLQALKGTDTAYDSRIHEIKPHQGQIETAENLMNLLSGSSFVDRKRIQEAYSFRCAPQILGAVKEAYSYVSKVVETELNSVTDNPLIFSKGDKFDVISGGNFHGEPVAIAMDTLAIGLSELANVSDRRIATLVDPATSNGLPAFLVEKGGLNSGFMILQYTTAALASENKVLAHPSSVDSIPTSANIEDLVSMGTIGARKAREIFENVTNVLSIELITACQAIDMRLKVDPKLKLSPKTKKIYDKIRSIVPYFATDDIYYPYVKNVKNNLQEIASIV